MRIGIPKEWAPQERRVALAPDAVARLVKQGIEVWVEAQAGAEAFYSDAAYEAAGAVIERHASALIAGCDLILTVSSLSRAPNQGPRPQDLAGKMIVGFLDPLGQPELCGAWAAQGVTALSMELIPRISRAQSMDALSSQASLAGYKAVLLAAEALPKYFPMLTTAAGTVAPAKVLVMGVGVAGLQAIATARRLGAVVEGFDIRPEVKDQVLSLGAKFIDVTFEEDTRGEGGYAKELSQAAQEHSRRVLSEHIHQSDVVITTAQVPGKKAPLLVTEEMLLGMKPGSVVVDLAAEQGGNCARSQPGERVEVDGITILGPVNLPASVPTHASQLYSKNLQELLKLLVKEGQIHLDLADEILAGACVTAEGDIRNPRVKSLLEPLLVG